MLLAVVASISLLFAQGFNPAPQPAPVQTTVRSEVSVQVEAPKPDPKAVADAATQSFQAIVVQLVAPTLVGWANDLLNIPDIIRQTPPDLTYGNTAVSGLADLIRTAALALVVVILLVWGIAKSLGEQPSMGQPIFGIVLAIGNLIWWEIGIGLNNAICNAIASPDLPGLARAHLKLPELTANPVDAFGPSVLVVVYAVVLLLLLLSMLFRLGLIDILIAVGALALICKGSAYSDGWTGRYVSLSTGTLFSQVLVVVALKLAPIMGGLGAGVASSLIGVIILLLARRMPQMLGAQHVQSSNSASKAGMGALVLVRRALVRV